MWIVTRITVDHIFVDCKLPSQASADAMSVKPKHPTYTFKGSSHVADVMDLEYALLKLPVEDIED